MLTGKEPRMCNHVVSQIVTADCGKLGQSKLGQLGETQESRAVLFSYILLDRNMLDLLE